MLKRFSKSATGFMIFIAIVAWLALILQLYISIKNTETNGLTPLVATWNFFSYFTVLTNLMIALCLSFNLLSPSSSTGRFFSKPTTIAAIALYIFIVGLTYNAILRFIREPAGLQKWVDEALHVAVPVFFVLFWLLFAPKGTLKWSHPFRWLVYPAVYLIYALLRLSCLSVYQCRRAWIWACIAECLRADAGIYSNRPFVCSDRQKNLAQQLIIYSGILIRKRKIEFRLVFLTKELPDDLL
jgi:hypothetical protein